MFVEFAHFLRHMDYFKYTITLHYIRCEKQQLNYLHCNSYSSFHFDLCRSIRDLVQSIGYRLAFIGMHYTPKPISSPMHKALSALCDAINLCASESQTHHKPFG